jgi:hypothetical protein
MRQEKLKNINRQIEGLFIQGCLKGGAVREDRNTGGFREYQGCALCDEVRRENYRLKQEALKC